MCFHTVRVEILLQLNFSMRASWIVSVAVQEGSAVC